MFTFVLDVGEIMMHEEAIKEACENLYNYLEVMKYFGGEEVIKYPIEEEKRKK